MYYLFIDAPRLARAPQSEARLRGRSNEPGLAEPCMQGGRAPKWRLGQEAVSHINDDIPSPFTRAQRGSDMLQAPNGKRQRRQWTTGGSEKDKHAAGARAQRHLSDSNTRGQRPTADLLRAQDGVAGGSR